jgi:hypothetical protein
MDSSDELPSASKLGQKTVAKKMKNVNDFEHGWILAMTSCSVLPSSARNLNQQLRNKRQRLKFRRGHE